ncbi:type II secretion system secretin GspD [Acidisoma cellulosilytica]|uniref:Type II secretion system secretin GspD n=1 Tax=Acidisoma cellulosilyticum TaxID=2802395 RepID=A0A963Z4A0_9PROT|nr:type II secretion system secretin GspD [Acidisoma cellulosilyticum]MCB8881483.1 type II secretion system secretin GspD [Acidisoma cellulosilyticum]
MSSVSLVHRYRLPGLLCLGFAIVSLNGCNHQSVAPLAGASAPAIATQPLGPAPAAGNGPISLSTDSDSARFVRPEVQIGTGQFMNPGSTQPAPVTFSGADVSLNFVNADARDVVQSVIGGILKQAYTVDPAVKGTVTLETPSPIPRSNVIGVLTNALQVSGIGLVLRGDVYAAVPIANAAKQAPLGASVGFVSRMVQLNYVSATEVEQALQPLVPPNASLRVAQGSNVLLVSGNSIDVDTLCDDIASFDVDYLRGMSFALVPLQNGMASEVATDVNKLLATTSRGIGDMVKVAPIERMNAILVTAMQPAYLRQVENWITRFDQGNGEGTPQLFIYRVQNGRATDLALVLRRALGIQDTAAGGATQSGGDGGSFDIQTNASDSNAAAGLKTVQTALSGAPSSSAAAPAQADVLLGGGGGSGSDAGAGGWSGSDVRVTADPTNNALIIMAKSQEYATIRAALTQLDVTPLQVLIEATVAQVTLSNQLSMGLQYYIKSGNFGAIFAPSQAGAASATTLTPFGGFALNGAANVLYAAGGTNIVLQALQSKTTVRVLSSPDLLVLNNETAKLQVGDQVPVATQSSSSTLTDTAQTVNAIAYRDTGVILQVTPRVNESGLVQLDLEEEVSAPTATATSSSYDQLNSPSISTRKVSSTLAINDGQTIVLAGLIQQTDSRGQSGLPWLQDIPVLGYLFGTKTKSLNRSELIVLITPYVIRNQNDADSVTAELRNSLRLTVPVAAQAE